MLVVFFSSAIVFMRLMVMSLGRNIQKIVKGSEVTRALTREQVSSAVRAAASLTPAQRLCLQGSPNTCSLPSCFVKCSLWN